MLPAHWRNVPLILVALTELLTGATLAGTVDRDPALSNNAGGIGRRLLQSSSDAVLGASYFLYAGDTSWTWVGSASSDTVPKMLCHAASAGCVPATPGV